MSREYDDGEPGELTHNDCGLLAILLRHCRKLCKCCAEKGFYGHNDGVMLGRIEGEKPWAASILVS